MSLPDPTLRLILLDLLFLGLAGAMAFWFRAWLKEQKTELDGRMASLESQQQSLARLSERLGGLCRTLERAPAAAAGAAAPGPGPRGTTAPRKVAGTGPWPAGAPGESRAARTASGAGWRREETGDSARDAYRQARELLDKGLSPAEISRRVGLGMTEVNVLKRMREAGPRR